MKTKCSTALWLGALSILLSAPGLAQAEDYTYTTNNGTITITRYTGSGGAVDIPGTITGLPVVAIGNRAFESRSLTSVNIPNNVTSIGDFAFHACTQLSTAALPETLTNIGVAAFENCVSLTSAPIPKNVTTIGGWAFYGTSLTAVTLPAGVTGIPPYAFAYCTLTTITLGKSVTNIANNAFWNCTHLVSVTLPESLTGLGIGAFGYCSQLENVALPLGLRGIPGAAFDHCSSLRSITIGNSLNNIATWAFRDCTSLKAAYFQGNAPSVDCCIFEGADSAAVYYLPGTTGWGPTFADRPTALWVLPFPVILTTAPNFGVQTNGFGFTISWATNATVVVEASTTLTNPAWSPMSTNTLSSGMSYFSDPQWINSAGRFYRVRSW